MVEPVKISTPCGDVFVVAFPKVANVSHREHIYKILSRATGKVVSENDMALAKGAPRPFFPELDLDANWTHSQDVCVLAYSFDAMVGIDLEFHRKSRQTLADRFFSEDEVQFLHDAESFDREFYRLWCRKEAFYKCHGGDFFAESLRRSMLGDSVENVHLLDLDAQRIAPDLIGDKEAGLCLAVELP